MPERAIKNDQFFVINVLQGIICLVIIVSIYYNFQMTRKEHNKKNAFAAKKFKRMDIGLNLNNLKQIDYY